MSRLALVPCPAPGLPALAVLLCALHGCARTAEPASPAARPAAAHASGAANGSAAAAPSTPPSTPPSQAAPPTQAARHTLSAGTGEQLLGLDEAAQALAQGDLGKAEARYRAVLDGPASGAAVSAGLAAAQLLETDAPDRADALYRRVLAIAPDMPEVHFAASRFYGSQRDTARALRHLARAVEVEPDFLPAYPLLGGLLVQAGRQDEAATRMVAYEQRLNGLLRRLAQAQRAVGERVGIIELLGYLDDERATEGLVARLADEAPEIRMAAGGALADHGDPASVQALASALMREADPVVRAMLTSALKRARSTLEASP